MLNKSIRCVVSARLLTHTRTHCAEMKIIKRLEGLASELNFKKTSFGKRTTSVFGPSGNGRSSSALQSPAASTVAHIGIIITRSSSRQPKTSDTVVVET